MNRAELLLIMLCAAVFLGGCAMTQMRNADILEKGEREFVLGLDSWNSPAWTNPPDGAWIHRSIPFTPNFQFGFGSKGPLDHTFSYGIQRGFAYALGIGIFQHPESMFKAAVRPEFALQPWAGNFKAVDRNVYARIPLLISLFTSERLAFTYSPQLTFAFPGYMNYRAIASRRYEQRRIWSHSVNMQWGKPGKKWVLSWALTSLDDSPVNNQISLAYIRRFRKM